MNWYKWARINRTYRVILSGNPHRIARRGKNILVGHALRAVGFWKFIWG